MEIVFEPIITWPKKPNLKHIKSPFMVGYNKLMDDLDRELRYLFVKQDADNFAIQVFASPDSFRIDGKLRADAKVTRPGVILNFRTKYAPYSYPCDTYDSWEANLRAISLSFTALRSVDRYGVTQHGEQYRGFIALPAPVQEDPAEFIAKHSDGFFARDIRGSVNILQAAYKAAAKNLHPDTPGGSEAEFKKLQWCLEQVNI